VIPLRDNIVSKTKPVVTWALILINAYCFYLELKQPTPEALEHWMYPLAVVPVRLWADIVGQSLTLITATFLHGGWLHIIGNMLFLYIFGDNVEDRMGHVRFLLFYLAVGMLANGTQAYISAGSKLPLVGASGAIAGVLGAYFYYYPYARVSTLFPFGIFSRIVEVPAFLFLLFWFVMQAMNGVVSLGVRTMQNVGGVAWWAHASGFVAGLLAGPALSKVRPKQRGSRS
jgi:membrane associated rhomboid family serine protease